MQGLRWQLQKLLQALDGILRQLVRYLLPPQCQRQECLHLVITGGTTAHLQRVGAIWHTAIPHQPRELFLVLILYIYTRTVDGFNINYPIILTPEEYEKLVLRESMRKYYKEKSDAIDGKKEGSEEKKKDLLPRYYVNSGFFETIFGSNTIDV